MNIDDELARIRSDTESRSARKIELMAQSRRTILSYQLAFADFYAALVKHSVRLTAIVELAPGVSSERLSATLVGYCWPYAGLVIMRDGTFNKRPPGPWGRGDPTHDNVQPGLWLGKGTRYNTQDINTGPRAAAAAALREAGILGEVFFVQPGYQLEEVDWLEDLQPEPCLSDGSPWDDLAVTGLGLHLALREHWPEKGPEPCVVDTSEGRHYWPTLGSEFAKYITSRTS